MAQWHSGSCERPAGGVSGVLALALVATACGGAANHFDGDPSESPAGDGDSENGDGDTPDGGGDGDGNSTNGDGDGDSANGDGDGDSTNGDGDGDSANGDGDGDSANGDGDGDGDTSGGCPREPKDTWLPVPEPPFPLSEPADLPFLGTAANWLASVRDQVVYILDRKWNRIAAFDTCSLTWEELSHDPSAWDGLYFYRSPGGFFTTSPLPNDETLSALDPEDGSVQELPVDFAFEVIPDPVVWPEPPIPDVENAVMPSGTITWAVDVWTGTAWMRFGLLSDVAEGCDNLPPDFMGGCDPRYVRTAFPFGGVYFPSEE